MSYLGGYLDASKAQWKTLSPKMLSPMPFKNMMKMASWLNCKRLQTKMNSKSQKVSRTW
jgi:hypothetical protein